VRNKNITLGVTSVLVKGVAPWAMGGVGSRTRTRVVTYCDIPADLRITESDFLGIQYLTDNRPEMRLERKKYK